MRWPIREYERLTTAHTVYFGQARWQEVILTYKPYYWLVSTSGNTLLGAHSQLSWRIERRAFNEPDQLNHQTTKLNQKNTRVFSFDYSDQGITAIIKALWALLPYVLYNKEAAFISLYYTVFIIIKDYCYEYVSIMDVMSTLVHSYEIHVDWYKFA